MFGLNMFKTEAGRERVDIYYSRMTPLLNQIVSLLRNEKPEIYGKFEDERCLLDLKEICYFDTVDRRTFAYTAEKVFQVAKSLAALEEELMPFGFVRINKAVLVNVFMIQAIKPEANMRILALLKNGEKLQINRRYKRDFEDYIKEIRRTI